MNGKQPAVTIALERARREGYGLGRAALAADVKASIELATDLEAANYFRVSAQTWRDLKAWFAAVIDDEAHR